MLGWDEKWSFVEHRFVKDGRVAGVVVMRGVFRSSRGTVRPADIVRDLGLEAQSPALPEWLAQWSASSDGMSTQLREEEAPR